MKAFTYEGVEECKYRILARENGINQCPNYPNCPDDSLIIEGKPACYIIFDDCFGVKE